MNYERNRKYSHSYLWYCYTENTVKEIIHTKTISPNKLVTIWKILSIPIVLYAKIMLLKDLPIELAKLFGNKPFKFQGFSNPLMNYQLNTRLIHKNGKVANMDVKYNITDSHEFLSSLSGPFFRLPVIGFYLCEKKPITKIPLFKDISVICDNKGTLVSSYPFRTNLSVKKLNDFTQNNGIKWYRSDGSSVFKDLYDCVSWLKQS